MIVWSSVLSKIFMYVLCKKRLEKDGKRPFISRKFWESPSMIEISHPLFQFVKILFSSYEMIFLQSFTHYNPLWKNETLKSNTDTSICATSNEWYFSICFVPTKKKLSTQSRVQSRHFTAFLYPVFFTHLSGRGRREMATLDIRQQTMHRSNYF